MRKFRPENHVAWLRAAFLTKTRIGSSDDLITEARAAQLRLLVRIPILIVVGLVISYFGVTTTLQTVLLIGVCVVVYRWWNYRPLSLKVIGGTLAAIVSLYALASVFHLRLLTVGLMALITLGLFLWTGSRPVAFIEEMTRADLMPDERMRHARNVRLRPTWWVLITVLAIIVFVPWLHSASLALALLCLFCVAAFLVHSTTSGARLVPSWQVMARMLTDYLTYPDAQPASVEWQPRESLVQRRATFSRLWMALTVLLAVGLSYCIPWELFGAHFQPGFTWSVPPPDSQARYAWLTRPFEMAFSANGDYRWSLFIGLILSLALPYAILFVVYFPAIEKLHRLLWDVQAEKDADVRTEFERDIERLSQSEHVETL